MSQRISRRDVLITSAGLMTIAGLRTTLAAAGDNKPNIVFVLADDMGYADLSVYGRRDFKTPVLDKLAHDGLLMSAGYANSAVCSATRFALITGRYQYRIRSGLFEPGPGPNDGDNGLPAGHPTLPSLLRAQGYRTSLFGKWHLGDTPQALPTKQGYDYFFGFLGGAIDYFRQNTVSMGPPISDAPLPGALPPAASKAMSAELYENETVVNTPGYLTDLLADRAANEIKQCAAQRTPFFISLHFNAPHWPWEGPNDEETAKNIRSLNHEDGGSIAKYGEMVLAMDTAIGRVLAQLKRSGVERDTLVIFTSDNGGERFSDTWPFTGVKGELLEGGLRVPLIMRWPARIKAGSKSDQVMVTMDFLPTLLAAAGGAPDPAYPSDGENLLPVLTGAQPMHPRKLFWRYKASEQSALREGDWKYLKVANQEYLFNLREDQRERANLRNRHAEIFKRLKNEYAAWNATMLPYPERSISYNPKGAWADRY